MLCTYCGRGHVAAACPTRPRAMVAALAALALGACSQTPDVPPARLAPPPAWLMQEPAPLEPVPACDGAVDCRTAYYARTRSQYADLAGRHRGLQRWVKAGSTRK